MRPRDADGADRRPYTPHEIASITGQSLKMVEHYTKEVNQHRMAKRTITRLARPVKNEP
jgi:hypothetical protein